MEEKEFMTRIKKILDNEEVNMNTVLADLDEWDSLSIVSYVAMANATVGKKILPVRIRDCVTIRDLYNLLVSE